MRRLSLALLLVGCSSTPDGYLYPPGSISTSIVTEDIDTDAQATPADPGNAVAVIVEYASGGTWHVRTTCDSVASGYSCAWDLVASVDQSATLQKGDTSELERDDQVLVVDPGAVRLILTTDIDVDGVFLKATPGATLGLDVILDGVHYDPADSRNPPIRWMKRGADEYASSNPVDLAPTLP